MDAGGVNHGFLLNGTTEMTLDFPGATFTQALGLNNSGMVDGVYMAGDATHGFVYNIATNAYQSFDDPNGIGTTTSNGINDKGQLVGFYMDANGNTDGLVATPIPEPASVLLLGSGLIALARRFRKQVT